MALDVDNYLFTKLWELIDASSAVTAQVKPNNKIRLELTKGKTWLETRRLPADFPYVAIEIPRSNGLPPPRVFKHTDGDGLVNHVVPSTHQIRITIATQDESYASVDPVVSAVTSAIYAEGVRLGTSWVSSMKVNKERTMEVSPRTGSRSGIVVVITCVFDCRPMLAQLLE